MDTEFEALRGVGRALRERIEALDPVSLAWSLLWQAEELQPWTPRAERHWDRLSPQDLTAAQDCWLVHHLALVHHARAYDAENAVPAQRAQALREWEIALGYWARLHASAPFWEVFRAHLDQNLGRQVPAEVVAAVRERLPGDLLAVHTALALEYRATDPTSAAAHLQLVIGSGFPPEAIQAARRELVADLDNSTAKEIERVRHEQAFDHLLSWLVIDPTNPWLLRNLLYVTDSWAKFLNKQPGWTKTMGPMLERTEKVLQAARAELDNSLAVLAGELARYESWRGFWRLHSIPRGHTNATPDQLRSRLRTVDLAISHLRRAIELDPSVKLEHYYQVLTDLAKALIQRAELRMLLGWDLAEIDKDLTEAHEYEPDLPAALELQARLRVLRGPHDTGDSQAQQTPSGAVDPERDDDSSAYALSERGEEHRLAQRYDEAFADLNRAITLQPDYAVAIARRGQTYEDIHRFEEALADYDRALALRADYIWIVVKRAGTYMMLNRYDEALTDYNRAIELRPDNVKAIAGRGQIYDLTNRYPEALAELDRAIELDPDYAWAIAQRGVTNRRTNRYEAALSDFNRAIDLDPGATWMISHRGETYRQSARYDEALADFDRAIELFSATAYPGSGYAWALGRRGRVHHTLGRFDDALADYNRALDLVPDDSWALAVRGDVYRLTGHHDEALADLNRAIDLAPDDAWTLARRGDNYRCLKQYNEALADLNRAIELSPDDAAAIAWRGETYRRLNRLDEALTDLNRAIELDSDYPWAIARRDEIHQQLSRP